MAAGAGRSADLAVKDSISERHHRLGGARGTGSLAIASAAPASGCVPSGGLASLALISPAAADALGRA